jgi:hypothetical protein
MKRLIAVLLCAGLALPTAAEGHVVLTGPEAKHQIRRDSPFDGGLHIYGCERLARNKVACSVEARHRQCRYRAVAVKYDNGDSRSDARHIRCD